MNDLLGATLDDLVASLKARRVRIPSEIGAFVALEVSESLLRGPARVTGADVRVTEDGQISIFAPPNSASPEESAQSVVKLLAGLLVAAGASVSPTLVALVEAGAPGGTSALARLRDELEASLVPLNRGAARRVLARMIREGRRAGPSSGGREGDLADVDAALDDLLGGGSKPSDPDLAPPPFGVAIDTGADLSDPFADPKERAAHPVTRPPPGSEDDELDALLGDVAETGEHRADEPTVPREVAERPRRDPTPRRAQAARAPASEPPAKRVSAEARDTPDPAPAKKQARRPDESLDDLLEPKPRGNGLYWAVAFVVATLAIGAGLALLRPDLVDAALGREPPPPAPAGPTPEEIEEQRRAHRARWGSVTVDSEPDRAQVLLFIGRGPAVAQQLPVGMAYEFVAIADGRAPTRAVVPADAEWEATPEGPRYELAMQTGDEAMDFATLVLGDTRLPRDALGAPGPELGSVRVVTSPPGAKVYLLVGFTPGVHVENIETSSVVEFLLYHEGHDVERALIAPHDWTEAVDGARSAEVSVTLSPRSRRR